MGINCRFFTLEFNVSITHQLGQTHTKSELKLTEIKDTVNNPLTNQINFRFQKTIIV